MGKKTFRGFQAEVKEVFCVNSREPIQDALYIRKKGYSIHSQFPPPTGSNGDWETRGVKDATFLNAASFDILCRTFMQATSTRARMRTMAVKTGFDVRELAPMRDVIGKFVKEGST
jgi:hypothetical protein